MKRHWDPTVPAVIAAIVMLVGTVMATGGIAPGEWRGTLRASGQSMRLEVRLAEGNSETRITTEVATAELGGFDAAAFGRSAAPLRLTWKRDAGTFVLEGEGGRHAGGHVRFEADPTFGERWRALGFEPLTESDVLRMAIEDVHLAEIERWRGLGLRLTLDDLYRLRAHGLSVDDASKFQNAGLHVEVENLIRLNSQGIDATYVKGLIDAGVAGDDLEGIVRLHAHGVPTDYAAQVRSSGLPNVDVDDVVRLHDQGVPSDYVSGLVASHLPDPTVDDVIRLHAHGVPADYVRAIVETGPGRRDADDAIRLHDHGVSADFVRSLVQAGWRDLSVDKVIRASALGTEALGAPASGSETR